MWTMRRWGTAWVLAACLAAVGSATAHALAYATVAPRDAERASLLAATGHAYLAWVPFALGGLAALALVAVVALARDAARRNRSRPVPSWRLALLPFVGFAVQEHAERLASGGGFPLHAALEPAFLVGLALQIPFALAALALARALLAFADDVGLALAGPPRRPRLVPLLARPAEAPPPARLPALAVGLGRRGPPVPTLA
jgi:hypothetical protein